MAEYTVYFTKTLSAAVKIKSDDENLDVEDAIELAYIKADKEGLLPSICAHCTGWGQPWSVDDSGDWEPDVEPVIKEN